MSAGFWPWLLLGAAWIAMGIEQILHSDEYDAQQGGVSKYRFGGRTPGRWWNGARGSGLMFIVVGLGWILMNIDNPDRVDPAVLGWMGAALILISLWSLVAEPQVSQWRRQRHERRVAGRLAR